MSAGYTITPKLKKQFADSMSVHLDSFEKMLLTLEKDPQNSEAIHSAFRAVHSIKGESDYIGIRDINTLTHELESLMDAVREGKIVIKEAGLSLLFDGLDLLKDMNRRITDEEYMEKDLSLILGRIEDITTVAQKEVPTPPKKPVRLDVRSIFVRSSEQHIDYIKQTSGAILSGESARGVKKNVVRTLKTFHTSANYAGFPKIAALCKVIKEKVSGARVVTKKLATFLLAKIEEIECLISGIDLPEVETGLAPLETETLSLDILGREIRVAPEKIDAFMNRVSELTIAKNTLNLLMEGSFEKKADPAWWDKARKVASAINKVSGKLQSNVINLRMVRINSIFERLPRIVRDLSRKRQRKIELILLGEKIEIDRKIIEHLIDPLIHIIRNAIDHGIESPRQRAGKGKAETGSITVKAYHEGTQAVIEVIDDGRGIDLDTIKKKAMERNFVAQDTLERMTDDEVTNLIFIPGFSTMKKATEVSGRGVGLDVVKNNMKEIGGNVTVSCEPGKGTRMRLQVPLTMSVTDVLLTEAGGEKYAIPLSAILETLNVVRSRIRILNNREAVAYNGAVLALKHTAGILGASKGVRLREGNPDDELAVIVLAFGKQLIGVVVDRIIRREVVLTKPLDHPLAGIREYSGAALLGDGSIVLVLDPMGMF